MSKSYAYIGTYTRRMDHVHGKADGIHVIEFDAKDGSMREINRSEAVMNSSYLCQNAAGNRLYAISEIYDYEGREDGCLSVFEIGKDHHIQKLQECSSLGKGPAYIKLDQSGSWLLCANYVEGNMAVYPVNTNGHLGAPTDSIQLSGSGPNTERQEAPHPHAAFTSPDNRFAFLVDLGTDRICSYELDVNEGKLQHGPVFHAPGGSGPRHMLFNATGEIAYCVLELTSEIAVLRYAAETGEFGLLDLVSTLPENHQGASHCSELCLSQDGRHLYVANRGHNTIATLAVDPTSGLLALMGHTDCQGNIPRHMCLSPTDSHLLIANQQSDLLACLKRDPDTGLLTPTEHSLAIPTPAFVEFGADVVTAN
ncbi:MAG: lactonase family protein [Verrucomicrobiota bacterium]